MNKNEAAKAFFKLADQLKQAGLTGGASSAAIRGDGKGYFFAQIQNGAGAYEAVITAKAPDGPDDAFAAALREKPDALAVLLLPGEYAQQAADTLPKLTAELDDMAQIVGLTARVAKALTPDEVKRCLKGRNSCFVKSYGMLLTGRSVTEAVTGAVLLDKAAMTHILAEKIGGAKRVPYFSAKLMHLVYQKKYSKLNLAAEAAKSTPEEENAASAENWSAREKELREQIVAFGLRLMKEGLLQGTWGNLAVRLDETHMLVTPSGLDYRLLSASDIVKVEMSTLAYGAQRKPTSEKKLHRDLFYAHGDVGACIHTHSRYCGVFAAARRPIGGLEKAARRKLGESVLCAPHALPSTGKLSKVALRALGNRNACLLMNHGVVCCGGDLQAAYEACEAAEQAAKRALVG
jgi:L-fuculose-phosphate aldolase